MMHRRSFLLLVGALLLTATLRVHGQSYAIADSVRLPAESYVGDPVELRYTVRSSAVLEAPEEVGDPGWGTIESVRVSERDGEYVVRIVVVPYEPGTLTLPPIELGEVTLEGMSLVVSSVLEGESEFRAIYGPQRLPGTQLAVVLVVLIIVIPATLALYFLGPGRLLVRRLLGRYRARVPYRNLMRTIDRLESGIRQDSSREFYTNLIYAVQDLMSNRLGFECRSATSSELLEYLPVLASRCGAPPSVTEPLADLLAVADEAKFAQVQVRRTVRLRHLEQCRSVMEQLEASRRRLHRARRQEGAHVGA